MLQNNKDYYQEYSFVFYLFIQGANTLEIMLVFYLNYFINVPHFLIKKRQPFVFSLAVLVLVFVGYLASLLSGFLLDSLSGKPPYFLEGNLEISLHIFFTPLLFIGLSTGIRLSKQYYEDLYDKMALKQQLKQAELDSLKSQINPHFLYNAFNSLYALAEGKSDKTAKAILQLSSIMRYVTYNATLPSVPIADELTFIKTYIEFQKLRIPDPERKIICVIEDPPVNFQVSPLLLITFIENAFKHTNLVNTKVPVQIHFSAKKNGFKFVVTNEVATDEMTHSGVGLTNLKKILQFTYPNSHHINTYVKHSIHHAELTLQL